MDEAYYQYVIESRIFIEKVPTIPAHCLIPLKARAYLDLSARRQAGDSHISTQDIKKHRNDVFRLYRTLAPADRYQLPEPLDTDLRQFLNQLPPESPDWSAIRNAVGDRNLPTPEEINHQLSEIFGLSVEKSEEPT